MLYDVLYNNVYLNYYMKKQKQRVFSISLLHFPKRFTINNNIIVFSFCVFQSEIFKLIGSNRSAKL